MHDDLQDYFETPAANSDVLPARGRRFAPRLGRTGAIVLGAVGLVLALSLAGASYAAYDYSKDYEGRILPGATIAGADVGGLTPETALTVVRAAARPDLDRVLTVRWKDRTWTVTPRELGARSNARALVGFAVQASKDTSFFEKVAMRVFGADLGFERDIAITYPRQGIRGYVEGLASALDAEVRDAHVDYSTGWVEVVREREGREVLVARSRAAFMGAIETRTDEVELRVRTVAPEVTAEEFEKVLLLRIGENMLYLYEDGKITHSWPVATGQPEYPTPTGVYEIVEKRYLPTWINPDPEGWGKDMPLQIPPGPGNPLGTRALNWSAEAIRFHGTSATYSLGYNASHGCVRMSMPDVEFLYELVDVGTPIVSTVVASLQPLYVDAPDPIPVAEDVEKDAGDTTDATGDANATGEPRRKKKDL